MPGPPARLRSEAAGRPGKATREVERPGRTGRIDAFAGFSRCGLLARSRRCVYNATREFCFRAGETPPLAVTVRCREGVERKSANPASPRANADGRQGRFGENPRPTVTVRMEEAAIRVCSTALRGAVTSNLYEPAMEGFMRACFLSAGCKP